MFLVSAQIIGIGMFRERFPKLQHLPSGLSASHALCCLCWSDCWCSTFSSTINPTLFDTPQITTQGWRFPIINHVQCKWMWRKKKWRQVDETGTAQNLVDCCVFNQPMLLLLPTTAVRFTFKQQTSWNWWIGRRVTGKSSIKTHRIEVPTASFETSLPPRWNRQKQRNCQSRGGVATNDYFLLFPQTNKNKKEEEEEVEMPRSLCLSLFFSFYPPCRVVCVHVVSHVHSRDVVRTLYLHIVN